MITSGCIAATPKGYVVKVLSIVTDDHIICQYPFHPKQFNMRMDKLRFLGFPRKPIPRDSTPFEQLITQRNQDAITFFLKPKKEKKEKSFLKQLKDAQSDPEEFKRLLESKGLI